jgi:hypothetical protein
MTPPYDDGEALGLGLGEVDGDSEGLALAMTSPAAFNLADISANKVTAVAILLAIDSSSSVSLADIEYYLHF